MIWRTPQHLKVLPCYLSWSNLATFCLNVCSSLLCKTVLTKPIVVQLLLVSAFQSSVDIQLFAFWANNCGRRLHEVLFRLARLPRENIATKETHGTWLHPGTAILHKLCIAHCILSFFPELTTIIFTYAVLDLAVLSSTTMLSKLI